MAGATGPPWSTLDPPLCDASLAALDALGFPTMTPVQAATIPVFLSHKDVSVQAVTGSGKTLSFVLPIFEMLSRRRVPLKSHELGALIISPTRELAEQIDSVMQHFARFFSHLRVASLIGGTNVEEAKIALRDNGANVVVGTPGRLESVLCHRSGGAQVGLDLREFEVLVLDEADRLLDLGFQTSISNILGQLPKQRRTGLFSATQTKQVMELARAGLRRPVSIDVKVEYKRGGKTVEQLTPSTLTNYYIVVQPEEKLARLVSLLKAKAKTEKLIVFFLTCATVDYLSMVLPELTELAGIDIVPLHGKMVTKKRKGAYKHFVSLDAGVMLCTDVAARGIDIPDVDWIVQYDAPQDPSFFVHRIGRTARMGRKGRALVYLLPEEDPYVAFLRQQNVPIRRHEELQNDATFAPAQPAEDDEAANGEDDDTAPPKNPYAESIIAEVRKLASEDRAVMEKAQHAFVSFVRAYKEHHCNYIFIFSRVPFAEVARGMGLLFFPRLPDLKHMNINFDAAPVRASEIKFKDKRREKQRKANYERMLEKREAERVEREARQRDLRKRKAKAKPKRRRKRRFQEMADEWDELQLETRLMKKLSQGKITQAEFDRALGNTELAEDDEGDVVLEDTSAPVEEEEAAVAAEASTSNGGSGGSKKKKKKRKKKKKKKGKAGQAEAAAVAAAEVDE